MPVVTTVQLCKPSKVRTCYCNSWLHSCPVCRGLGFTSSAAAHMIFARSLHVKARAGGVLQPAQVELMQSYLRRVKLQEHFAVSEAGRGIVLRHGRGDPMYVWPTSADDYDYPEELTEPF